MRYKLCRLIRRLQRNKKRLHNLIGITEGQILEAVAGESADAFAFAAANYMISVKSARLTGNQFVKIHAELVGDLVDHADREVAVLLKACIDLTVYMKLIGQTLLRVVAYLAQFTDARCDLDRKSVV